MEKDQPQLEAKGVNGRTGAQPENDAGVSVPLSQLASVIRSKLAGPFRVTFDVIFKDPATYERVVAAGVLTKERIAKLYGVPQSQISSVFNVPMAYAIKFTMKRELDPFFATSDSHGAQQHAPLLTVLVPVKGSPKARVK
jgi:hypothetical protein